MNWRKKLLGIDEKGRPPFHNSRQSLLIGGLVCLLIHPGIVVVTHATGLISLDAGEEKFIMLNPYLLVTVLGVWLSAAAVFSTQEWPKYKNANPKRKQSRSQK